MLYRKKALAGLALSLLYATMSGMGLRGSSVVCSALHGALIIQIASNRLLGRCPHPSFPAESLLAVKMTLFGV